MHKLSISPESKSEEEARPMSAPIPIPPPRALQANDKSYTKHAPTKASRQTQLVNIHYSQLAALKEVPYQGIRPDFLSPTYRPASPTSNLRLFQQDHLSSQHAKLYGMHEANTPQQHLEPGMMFPIELSF